MTTESRRVFLATTMAVLCAAAVGGCNTVEGVGQDVENLGDAIGDEARDQKRKN